MVKVNGVYLNSSALQNLVTRNIQNVDLNYCPMVNNEMRGCFYDNQNIVSVSNVNQNVTRIIHPDGYNDDQGCFYNCQNLVNVPDLSTVPVTNLQGCFYNCQNLTDAPYINDYCNNLRLTFWQCENLVNVPHLPNYITELDQTFLGCSNLVNVPELSNSLIKLGRTFSYCSNLVNAPEIPNSVIRIAEAFEHCSSLVNVPEIPNSVTNMSRTFQYCTNLVNTPVIPNSVTDMEGTFLGCSNLVNVSSISNSINALYYTFQECYNLVDVPSLANCTNLIDMVNTFTWCHSLVNAPELPNSLINMVNTFTWCHSLVNVPEIPNSVTNMSGTFRGCENLVNAPEIPNSVQDIYATFERCFNLVNAPEIPNSVTTMAGTFQYCNNLANVPSISNNTCSLSESFMNCFKIETIPELPEGLIGYDDAFSNCTNLQEMPRISNNCASLYNTFYNCYNMTNAKEIFGNIMSMTNTFYNCQNISGDIVIHSELVQSAQNCFNNTTAIKNVYIPFVYLHDTNISLESWSTGIYVPVNSNNILGACHASFDNNLNYCGDNRWLYIQGDNQGMDGNYSGGTGCYRTPLSDINISFTAGDYSATYNAFINAGYGTDPTNRVDGVCLFDIYANIYGTIDFVITPSQNTSIYLDNRLITGTTKQTFPSNNHSYMLINPDYMTYCGTASVESLNTTTITKDLTSLTNYAITFTTNVSGCNVVFNIDGVEIVPNGSGTTYTLNLYTESQKTISYVISKSDYRTIRGTLTFNNADISQSFTMEETTEVEYDFTYPFTDSDNRLVHLVDNDNFIINSTLNALTSGPSSYYVDNGTSYGYITFTTVDACQLLINGYVSSEDGWDYGGVYVGTQIYEPTRQQMKNQTVASDNGTWLFVQSGTYNVASDHTMQLQADTTYVISFAYAKDSGANSGEDRLIINRIKFNAISE